VIDDDIGVLVSYLTRCEPSPLVTLVYAPGWHWLFGLLVASARWQPLDRRRAAAIALVGWYLIIPSSTLPPGVAYNEPLSEWQIVRGFDGDRYSRMRLIWV
jgi:hypothetical protein